MLEAELARERHRVQIGLLGTPLHIRNRGKCYEDIFAYNTSAVRLALGMSDAEIERAVKETVGCTLTIPCKDCAMMDTCMMKVIEVCEGITAKKCPNCNSPMEYHGSYWEVPQLPT
ncbi:hypothetical protein COS86_05115 [Candidatus Bathyarchaeota archaeon CG07_land_8_20_14_0_80_47_9]|nr:MAG: hypothetical protein COS86_05115 [Candidatus Bathyarchaeota archaeon CG07_land_8_20_14_0_80_47_9]